MEDIFDAANSLHAREHRKIDRLDRVGSQKAQSIRQRICRCHLADQRRGADVGEALETLILPAFRLYIDDARILGKIGLQ